MDNKATATAAIALLAPETGASVAVAGIPDYLTVAEIAAKIKATPAFIYKEIADKRLEADRFGALVRVTPEQFDRWRSRQPKPKAAA